MIDRKRAAPSLKPGESNTARYLPLIRSTHVTSHGLSAFCGAASASTSPFVSGSAAAKDAAPNELRKSRRRMDMENLPLKLDVQNELHDAAGVQRVGNLAERWRSQQRNRRVELRMIRHVQRFCAECGGLRPV